MQLTVLSTQHLKAALVLRPAWPSKLWKVDFGNCFVTLTSGSGFNTHTKLVQKTLIREHESSSIHVLKRLSKEKFPLSDSSGQHVLDMNGSSLHLFGVANFSVYMIGWIKTDDSIEYWFPRRAAQMSYPNMFDTTASGSLRIGEAPIECIIRECEEDICLYPTYTWEHIKACGTASYH